MDIQNIVWDVDGTLFDTYPAITYAFSKTLNRMGYAISLNVIDGLVRQSMEQCVELLSQRFNLKTELLRTEFTKSYGEISLASQPAYPGVREVCEFINQNHGRNVIVTLRGVQSTQALLVAHELTPFFDDIFSIEQDYPRKPDPEMVLAAINKYGMVHEETLLIGNHEIDIQTGRAAGIHTCLFGNAELTQSADLSIEDYQQLLDLLIQ